MDNTQSGMKARVDVKRPWLAILPLMLGSFVGMFSETSLNIALPQLMKASSSWSVFNSMAGYRLYARNRDSPATFKFAY